VGLLVFWAAYRATQDHALSLAFSPDTPRSLVRSGIYARIRHPFYTAYGLTWLAGVVQAPFVSTVVSTGVMLTLYVIAARYEEAKFKVSGLADEYRAYRSEAGMFWPTIL
jgi:protein-S-isoprenylcysteine O-methyltransferase Ste14